MRVAGNRIHNPKTVQSDCLAVVMGTCSAMDSGCNYSFMFADFRNRGIRRKVNYISERLERQHSGNSG